MGEICLRPIGQVVNEVPFPAKARWGEVVSQIVLDPRLAEALDGLEEFSHLIIVFWMDRVPEKERTVLKVHPRQRRDLPLVGVLATRSPARPNPIGVTTVRLLGRKGNVLKVQGLDAYDGTPVLDIKPFLQGDAVLKSSAPAWVSALTRGE